MFSTQNNGFDTVKSPMGLFDEPLIDNDLAEVDRKICEFYKSFFSTTTEEPDPDSPDTGI
jgi:hypothetical protein